MAVGTGVGFGTELACIGCSHTDYSGTGWAGIGWVDYILGYHSIVVDCYSRYCSSGSCFPCSCSVDSVLDYLSYLCFICPYDYRTYLGLNFPGKLLVPGIDCCYFGTRYVS